MSSIDQLCVNIKRAIEDAVKNEVTEQMIEIVKEHIDEDVYSAYEPSEYRRTRTLQDSLQKTVSPNTNGIKITIDHDSSKMDYQSKVSGQSVDEQQKIPNAIEYGKIHPLFGEGFSYLSPRPYMSNAEKEILSKLDNILGKAIVRRLG